MELTCKTCGITKPETEFYKNPHMATGRFADCKSCHKRTVLARQKAHIEALREGKPRPKRAYSQAEFAVNTNIDLGLAVLSAMRLGHAFTLEEIADICECNRERIRQIEVKAKTRSRQRLMAIGGHEIIETLQAV